MFPAHGEAVRREVWRVECMIRMERILGSVAECLERGVPEADENGDWIFNLAGDMKLGIRDIPGGEGVVAWSVAATPKEGDDAAAAEKRAAGFLQAGIARFRDESRAVGTRDEKGALILFTRLTPESEEEWIDAVSGLLNEAEIQRRMMTAEGASTSVSGLYGLR